MRQFGEKRDWEPRGKPPGRELMTQRGAIGKALQTVENYSFREWPTAERLGPLI
jgi:hypothetical protein